MRGRVDGALDWCIGSGSVFCFGSCSAMTHPLLSGLNATIRFHASQCENELNQ